MRGADVPRDLRDQTALVLGLGQIGREFARLARVLGLNWIAVFSLLHWFPAHGLSPAESRPD